MITLHRTGGKHPNQRWGVFKDNTLVKECDTIEEAERLAEILKEDEDVDYTGRGRRSVGGVGFEG